MAADPTEFGYEGGWQGPSSAAFILSASPHPACGCGCGEGCGSGCGGGWDPPGPMTIHYHFVDGTAHNDADFDGDAGEVTFYPTDYAYSQAAIVYVPTIDDDLAELTETFRIEITSVDTSEDWEWAQDDFGDDKDTAEAKIFDNEPTVTISAADTAAEVNQTTGRFTITRTGGPVTNPLTVQFALDGSTAESSDYTLLDAHTNQPVSSSLTIPAGYSSNDIIVKPTDDTTPEWTETVKATLDGTSPAHYWFGQPSDATVQIVDNDFGFTLQTDLLAANYDDDNDNGVTDYNDTSTASGGDDDLYELKLNAPAIKIGTSVSVTLPPETVNVYDSKTKGQKLLGDTSTSTLTFDSSHPLPSSLWVEVKAGSEAEGDLVTQAASYYNATRPSNGTKSQANTGINLIITANSHPNGDTVSDATNQSRDWLVGQLADLSLTIQAPATRLPDIRYQWTVPGQTLYKYVATDSRGYGVPLADANEAQVGLSRSSIKFFWASTSADAPGHDEQTVSVLIRGIRGGTLSAATTKFNVYTPMVCGTVDIGTAKILDSSYIGLGGIESINPQFLGGEVGIRHEAAVTVPNGFAEGHWNYLQMVQPNRHRSEGSSGWHPEHNLAWGIDGINPYGAPADATGGHDNFDGSVQYTWHTGEAPHWIEDRPASAYVPGGGYNLDEATINDSFQTWVMFLPPGQGSQWVPVMRSDWNFYVKAIRAWTIWRTSSVYPPSSWSSGFVHNNVIPTWNMVHTFSNPPMVWVAEQWF